MNAINRIMKVLLAVTVVALSITGISLSADVVDAQGLLCPAPVNLHANTQGYVLAGPPNIVHSTPSVSSNVVGYLDAGSRFTVLDGPRCVDHYNWWLVTNGAVTGWTADGDGVRNWLAPVFNDCVPLVPSRLSAGRLARVTPGLPNVIRGEAGGGARLGTIPAGGVITLIHGPQCVNGSQIWWYMRYNGIEGWTGELDGIDYWLEPYAGPQPQPQPNCTMPFRLQVNRSGVVLPGTANILRSSPGTDSPRIGTLPAGTVFSVIGGPVCAGIYQWWQVNANGQIGWTAEGASGTYYVAPVVCGNGTLSWLTPNMIARVTPGLPNRLRLTPSSIWGLVIANIPAGGTVRVLDSYSCDSQGRLWWRVNYNGYIGWTAEGDGGVYWLEPA